MIDEKYQELIDRSVDETLTPEEQADLEAYLKANPEARRYYDRLHEVTGLLTRMPRSDAPEGFTASVMDSIRHGRDKRVAVSQKGLFTRIAEAFRQGRGWRYTYAFSAGLACGILILAAATYFTDSSAGINAAHVSGTMSAAITGSTTLIDKQEFEIGTVRGTIEARRGDGIVIIDGNVPSPDESTVELTYDANDLAPASIWQPEPYTAIVSANRGAVNLEFPGSGRFAVIFRDKSPAASSVICRISTGGVTRTVDIKTESPSP